MKINESAQERAPPYIVLMRILTYIPILTFYLPYTKIHPFGLEF